MAQLYSIPEETFLKCFQQWQYHWEKCMLFHLEYREKGWDSDQQISNCMFPAQEILFLGRPRIWTSRDLSSEQVNTTTAYAYTITIICKVFSSLQDTNVVCYLREQHPHQSESEFCIFGKWFKRSLRRYRVEWNPSRRWCSKWQRNLLCRVCCACSY